VMSSVRGPAVVVEEGVVVAAGAVVLVVAAGAVVLVVPSGSLDVVGPFAAVVAAAPLPVTEVDEHPTATRPSTIVVATTVRREIPAPVRTICPP
jgi:hypothetical protein